MWKTIGLILLSTTIIFDVRGQSYQPISHGEGSAEIAGIEVAVTKLNNPRPGQGGCGTEAYWIGYAANNGYQFDFSVPVRELRLQIAAINNGEHITFLVNGDHFTVTSEMMTEYYGNCYNVTLPTIKDGDLVGEYSSNASILIRHPEGIKAFSIMHLNGRKGGAGSVFEIAIPENGGLPARAGPVTAISDLSNNEFFSLMPNPTTEHVKIDFLPLTRGIGAVTLTDVHGKTIYSMQFESTLERQALELDVSNFIPGSYFVELRLNEQVYRRKLVKL